MVYSFEDGIKQGNRNMFAVAVIGLIAAVTVLLFTAINQVSAAGNVVVTPTNEASHGWLRTESGGGTISYVSSPGAMGLSALQFSTTADNTSYTRFRNNITNVSLSSLTTLSYKTKQVSGTSATAAVNLRLYVDRDANGTYDDVLVYEPYYNATLTTEWQTWNITQNTGYWWSNNGFTYSGKGGVSAGSNATNFTLSDVVAQYSSAQVDEFGLGTGTDNPSWVVQADALTINDTTYNFESGALSPVATNKEQCKNGGHLNFQAAYKNQGQCVAAVQSNENSKHNR